jgi:hypothetical protein
MTFNNYLSDVCNYFVLTTGAASVCWWKKKTESEMKHYKTSGSTFDDGTISLEGAFDIQALSVTVEYSSNFGLIDDVYIISAMLGGLKVDRDMLIMIASKAEVEKQELWLAETIQDEWEMS